MIFTFAIRVLFFLLVYTSFTPLQAVHIANDPYEVDYLSDNGQRVKTLLEILGRKNHLHIVASYNSEQQRFMHTCPKIDTTIPAENAHIILDLFLAKIPKERIDTRCDGQEQMSALFYAALWGNDYEITKKLVQAGAKVFTKHATAGLLPKRAIIQGNLACFQALYDTWHEKQIELAIKNLFKPKTKKTYPS